MSAKFKVFPAWCRRKFKTGKDVGTKAERLKGEVGEDFWPAGLFWIWGMRNNPEAFVRVMDEGDDFAFGGELIGSFHQSRIQLGGAAPNPPKFNAQDKN